MNEREIIIKMRQAIDCLKEKYMEAEGNWAVLDFLSAATDESHWMRSIAEAERLSDPYMPKSIGE